jgi:hypothetical protein
VLFVGESTVEKLDNLRDNGKREENTLGGFWCWSDSCKKTEEKNVIKLFKLVDGELIERLSGEINDIKTLKSLLSNSGNVTL